MSHNISPQQLGHIIKQVAPQASTIDAAKFDECCRGASEALKQEPQKGHQR